MEEESPAEDDKTTKGTHKDDMRYLLVTFFVYIPWDFFFVYIDLGIYIINPCVQKKTVVGHKSCDRATTKAK